MKKFCFTVDDNIRFLKDINEKKPESIFHHPYLAMFKRLHEAFDLKVQLNLFYYMEGFNLSQMTTFYRQEFENNYDWLKFSFHSDVENIKPYEFSGYDEVYQDCKKVNDNIVRFASESALAKTTTVHYCLNTADGLRALKDNNVSGLLGLFGDADKPRTSYGIDEIYANKIRNGEIVKLDGINFASIDIVLNCFSKEDILTRLEGLNGRDCIKVMIHEQYFYHDYKWYQPEFEEKLKSTFSFLAKYGYKSEFLENLI